jgi:hypothetical protein
MIYRTQSEYKEFASLSIADIEADIVFRRLGPTPAVSSRNNPCREGGRRAKLPVLACVK